ncbi:MAG: RNA polymerase sigma factor [Planctomycetes bacterium]|nr:RNA polymerase sigma factor [Planctomycetota bacterium]
MRSLQLAASSHPAHRTALEVLASFGIELAPEAGEPDLTFSDRIDTTLMALFRDRRAPEAFEVLYQRARGGIFDLVRRLTGERGLPFDPLELVQDTFINVYRYAKGFRDEHAGSFRAWARTIAQHTVYRAATRRRMRSLQSLPEGAQEPADERQLPARGIVEREDVRQLAQSWIIFLDHYARAYAELSPRDRRALHLVEVEGLSYEEAARVLVVGRSNMKMILFRARGRIQARMRASMAVDAVNAAEQRVKTAPAGQLVRGTELVEPRTAGLRAVG